MTHDSPSRPRIAVIGVHGVADQLPASTARTIAGLLTRLVPAANGKDGRGCSAFEEQPLRIPAW
jgi:hypothetical protein